ncbi:hypothetical protein GTP46_27790 [Duganella sp. FT135W]|uniref:DUF4019 domain-containing protein n=1 Tax=Duganella flavida TaxID=2692175 RepID=A0A6L8KH46_9BURK|nr:hypothetical protein [Duganella flavida]MYM26435.1 hypothetical protein [Duganella flavida]
MRKLIAGLSFALACLHASANESIAVERAVRIAEHFVAENGYTNLPESRVKEVLDNEAIEWRPGRSERLAQRYNTLRPKTIGAKKARKNGTPGWSVAFDYMSPTGNSNECRVVTMDANGRDVRVEHVDGIRSYFLGFEKSE